MFPFKLFAVIALFALLITGVSYAAAQDTGENLDVTTQPKETAKPESSQPVTAQKQTPGTAVLPTSPSTSRPTPIQTTRSATKR